MNNRQRLAGGLCLLLAAILAGAYLLALLPDALTLVAALVLAGLGLFTLTSRPPNDQ